MSKNISDRYDARAKEDALRAESQTWDTSAISVAEPSDVPVIDLTEFLTVGNSESLEGCSQALRHACLDRQRRNRWFQGGRAVVVVLCLEEIHQLVAGPAPTGFEVD